MNMIIYSFILFFLINTSVTKDSFSHQNPTPTKFVFEKYRVLTESGIDELTKMKDSAIDNEYNPSGKGTITNESLKKIPLPSIRINSDLSQVYVDIINDSIWRYTKQNNKFIQDYILIKKDNGIIKYYDKSRTVNIKERDLFKNNDTYRITRNENDKKNILGYECFKITLIKVNNNSEFGNTIFEMYVTNKIRLPIHSVINFTKFIPNLFPMEIRMRPEKVANKMEIFYKLVKIE